VTTTSPAPVAGHPQPAPRGLARLWQRQLQHYPANGPRAAYLAITVLATVTLYYEFYVPGSVAPRIIQEFGFSFAGFVYVQVVAAAVGAFASLFAGLSDRWGRVNIVIVGLLVTGLIILFGIPNATDKAAYTTLWCLLSFVEGIILVATPALVRDFSPQIGRASAMAFWALGPVLGSLVVTVVSSNTLPTHPDWRFQFQVCGIVGLVVFVIALLWLRELSPGLRDQLMVTLRDRALIEARAAGIDPEALLKHQWRQMLRLDIIGPAFAVSVYLLLYYVLVGLATVYFGTVYGYDDAETNSLLNWYWGAQVIGLIIAGPVSDWLRVRKPFMVAGGVVGLVGTALFALSATDQRSYGTIAVYFVVISTSSAFVMAPWFASFTETVEKRNPAATATGLAVYGWILRAVVTIALFVLTLIVPATTTLVDKAGPIQAMQQQNPTAFAILTGLDPATAQALAADPANLEPAVLAKALTTVATLEGASAADAQGVADVITGGQAAAVQSVDPATLAALRANPADPAAGARAVTAISQKLGIPPAEAVDLLQSLSSPQVQANLANLQKYGADLQAASTAFSADQLAYLKTNGPVVAKAAADNPGQWRTWWWICVAGQIVFLPFVFLLTGRWSPSRARQDEAAHEALVQGELANLRVDDAARQTEASA
jgi:MFS transporter, ACS family, D-galactonate transporter